MAKLEIYVTADGGNTVSQFYVSKSEHVAFHNEGDEVLTIVVKDPVGVDVLCAKNNGQDPKTTFEVPAKSAGGPGKVKMFICDGYQGKTFKYSAEIAGKIKEDPIIIIGRDSSPLPIVAYLPGLAGGLVLGIVLTLLVQRLFVKQRPT
jgi:hypothetical protein